MGEELKQLSERVLATLSGASTTASSPSDGVVWDAQQVSACLHELHLSLQQQLQEEESEFHRVNGDITELRQRALEESKNIQQRVDGVTQELVEMEPVMEGAATHFNDLVRLLEPATVKLQTLTSRANYLATAIEIERHSQQAKARAVEATGAALDAFQAFSLYVQTIPVEYTALQREAMHRVEDLSIGIKQYAIVKLQKALEEIEWPRALDQAELAAKGDQLTEIGRVFSYLVTLHVSQLDADRGGPTNTTTAAGSTALPTPRPSHQQQPQTTATATATIEYPELWAMECLLEPLRMRFRYHFERAESKTNRITKPEWFLSHILEQTRAHELFLTTVISPELKKTLLHHKSLDCVDAQVLFLRGLIRTASKKLLHDLPAIVLERAVFCHVIDEIVLFEQAVDENFGYDSYASTQPLQFPRLVDVLTSDTKTLFTWTKIDVEYAKKTLQNTILAVGSETDPAVAGGQCWAVTAHSKIPPAADRFIGLLDFMCRRFAHFSNDGHRYLYISQVHFELLGDFHRACLQRLGQLKSIKSQVHQQPHQSSPSPLLELFAVVNSSQSIVDVLHLWDENVIFIELMRKVAESETSRSQILRMHFAYSKTMFKNVAKAAKETIMAREEAMAVRQAISGPGAMIGPTAAFSAAYSMGSKTVNSLFGRHGQETAGSGAMVEPLASATANETSQQQQQQRDAEELLFSRTMFEKQAKQFTTLVASTLAELHDVLMSEFQQALVAYRKSPHWLRTAPHAAHEISSELAPVMDIFHQVLTIARAVLISDDVFTQLWKRVAASVDDAVYTALAHANMPPSSGGHSAFMSLSSAATALGAVEPPPPPRSSSSSHLTASSTWSASSRTQFIMDMQAISSIFQASGVKNPRVYLRKTFDLCRLVEMPSAKLAEIYEALRGVESSGSRAGSMDQITTILEACSITALSPYQVQCFCHHQLGLQ